MINNTGEARDDMSMLPRSAATKIFSYLSIIDLYRCAQVCRAWKMITNSNILWSKLNLYPIRHKYIKQKIIINRSLFFTKIIYKIIKFSHLSILNKSRSWVLKPISKNPYKVSLNLVYGFGFGIPFFGFFYSIEAIQKVFLD